MLCQDAAMAQAESEDEQDCEDESGDADFCDDENESGDEDLCDDEIESEREESLNGHVHGKHSSAHRSETESSDPSPIQPLSSYAVPVPRAQNVRTTFAHKIKSSSAKLVELGTSFVKRVSPWKKKKTAKKKVDVRNPPVPPWAEVYEDSGEVPVDSLM